MSKGQAFRPANIALALYRVFLPDEPSGIQNPTYRPICCKLKKSGHLSRPKSYIIDGRVTIFCSRDDLA